MHKSVNTLKLHADTHEATLTEHRMALTIAEEKLGNLKHMAECAEIARPLHEDRMAEIEKKLRKLEEASTAAESAPRSPGSAARSLPSTVITSRSSAPTPNRKHAVIANLGWDIGENVEGESNRGPHEHRIDGRHRLLRSSTRLQAGRKRFSLHRALQVGAETSRSKRSSTRGGHPLSRGQRAMLDGCQAHVGGTCAWAQVSTPEELDRRVLAVRLWPARLADPLSRPHGQEQGDARRLLGRRCCGHLERQC